MSEHPWSLVAPWYRWHRFGVEPRQTPPVLHKYETPTLVDMFRDNPQHSLKFTPEDVIGERRKLFLAQHKRFYLVVCELHCDRRGFPNAGRDEVCEAGFVLRRRRVPVPQELAQEASRLVRRIAKRRAQLAMLRNRQFTPSSGGRVAVAVDRHAARRESYAQRRLLDLQQELGTFAGTNKLSPVLEGWVPSEQDGVGAWSQIEEGAPHDGEEQVFGLFALIPDPTARPHAARGRSLYFGLVPTASSDTTPDGEPRFDVETSYELQCFVRRHDPRCPRKPGNGRDCRGELTWSLPSEPFTLASPQDLIGTSNRPVTVQLPNIPELLDQARTLPFGAGAPLRMAAPDDSSLPVIVDADGKAKQGARGAAEICSFAIPLITIIAFFVLRLFLPIVVLLFGLWFLLKLKFCLPPKIALDAGLTAELEAVKGGAELSAGVEARLEAGIKGIPGDGYDGKSFSEMGDDMTPEEFLEVLVSQQAAPEDPAFGYPPPLPAGALPSPNSALAPLIWEDELPIPELEEVA